MGGRNMKNMVLALTGILAYFIFMACARPERISTAPAIEPAPVAKEEKKTDWEVEWENSLKAARKEGKVVILTTTGSEVRKSVGKAFEGKYGISIEWIPGRAGVELNRRLITERNAGLYLADVMLVGSSTMITELKPKGILAPLLPLILLPEIKDPSQWYGGKLPFADKERRYVFPPVLYVSTTMFLNEQLIKTEVLKSHRGFLKPELKGKIIMGDPTIPSAAMRWFGVTAEVMGLEFLKEFANQLASVQRDERMVVEWVAAGKYPIGIGVKTDPIMEFRRAGAPIRHFTTKEINFLSGGSGVLCVINNPAHPQATKVFANWLLSREGQLVYSRATGLQSARLDVPTDFLDPIVIRSPSISYFNTEEEDFLLKDPEYLGKAREILRHLLR